MNHDQLGCAMIPESVREWLALQGYGLPESLQPVSGGCINNGQVLKTNSGRSFFLKTNTRLPQDAFQRELEGLEALRSVDGPRAPEPLLAGSDFLLMENIKPGSRRGDFWSKLGEDLAALHQHTSQRFGFGHDNYLGSTPQPNPWMEDGHEFFSEQRVLFQARLAQRNGYFQSNEMRLTERLCKRLKELIPEQPASLIHGDLWGGNVIADESGGPVIIDPAVHYGWGEAELGMTILFGGFGQDFYQAYVNRRGLDKGWQERMPVYNLYHLMNHLNLFGGGYYADVVRILTRYGS